MGQGKDQQRIGRSQAKIASLTKMTLLTDKDKLKLGKAAAKNIVEGTIKHNKELKNKKPRVSRRVATGSKDAKNRMGVIEARQIAKALKPEIKKATAQELAAALK